MMQQVGGISNHDRIVVVYTASSWTEAIVVRGLLESAGIPSPALGDGNPPDVSIALQGIEIYALDSQADHARQVLREYLDLGAQDLEEGRDESPES